MHSALLTQSLVFSGKGLSTPTITRCLLHRSSSWSGRTTRIHSMSRRPSIFSKLTPSTSFSIHVPTNAINLNIETYRDEKEKPCLLPIVRHIERELANDRNLDYEFLDSTTGYQPFIDLSTHLLFKPIYKKIKDNLVAIQTVSATGALRLGFEFMSRVLNSKNVLISNPVYSDYHLIATNSGIANVQEYPYYDFANRKLDVEQMLNALRQAEPNSIVVLQLSHSSGLDPSTSQWLQIAEVVKENNLLPFFDVQNIGLCSGSVEDDAYPLRIFVEKQIEFFVAQSFSKNFGLYNERVGSLSVFATECTKTKEIKHHLHEISRTVYTAPPNHGARIVSKILQIDYFRQQWKVQVQSMYVRTQKVRKSLRKLLEEEKGTPGTWNHLTESSGLFLIIGLNENQLNYLKKKHGIYTGPHGRINISMLNENNLEKIANAIDDAARNA